MLDKKKITILIPTRNRFKMFKRALKSVLEQTYSNLQIIILDNNSSDETSEYCKNLIDKKIKYHQSKEDLTMLENWKRGLELIETKYFLRLDDDNFYSQNFIEKIYYISNQNDFSVTFFNDISIKNGELTSRWKITNEIFNLDYKKLLKLEFSMETDSNFCLIDFEKIRGLINIQDIYQTNLPDRYLILRLLHFLKNNQIKVGLCTTPGGYVLLGHQNSEVAFEVINYSNLDYFSNFNLTDASGNIYLHKIMVFQKFLNNNNDKNISNYMETNCNSKFHNSSVAYYGHMFRLTKIKNYQDIKILFFYFFKILLSIIRHPFKIFDGKVAFIRIPSLIIIFFNKIFAKENNKILCNKKNDEIANKIIMDKIFIDLKKLNFKKIFFKKV